MLTLITLVLAAAVVIFGLWAWEKFSTGPKFKAKTELLRPEEQTLYHRLVRVLPEKTVLAQVAFSQMLYVEGGSEKENFGKMARAKQKVADYVICGKGFNIEAVIELDGYSHRGKEAKDAARDAMLNEAGIKTMRFDANKIPSEEELRRILVGAPQLH